MHRDNEKLLLLNKILKKNNVLVLLSMSDHNIADNTPRILSDKTEIKQNNIYDTLRDLERRKLINFNAERPGGINQKTAILTTRGFAIRQHLLALLDII